MEGIRLLVQGEEIIVVISSFLFDKFDKDDPPIFFSGNLHKSLLVIVVSFVSSGSIFTIEISCDSSVRFYVDSDVIYTSK